jgi:hypothetical protein
VRLEVWPDRKGGEVRGRFKLGIVIAVSVLLISLVAVLFFAKWSPVSTEPQRLASSSLASNQSQPGPCIAIPFIANLESLDPTTALKYGITGYLEITYPSRSPKSLSVDRGGEINISILLHFVSYAPETVTEAEVNINPSCDSGRRVMQGDVILGKLVSYSAGGNITIQAGETVPVTMTLRIPEDFPESTARIFLYAAGITTNLPMIDELGLKEVTIGG